MASTAASYRNSQSTQMADPGQLLRLSNDLAALCSEGLLEVVIDEHGVIRYRPIELAKVA